MEKIRLAIFTGSDIRNYGGGEKYVIELANRLYNFDITIFTYRDNIHHHRMSFKEIKQLTNAKIIYYNAIRVPISKELCIITKSGFNSIRRLKNFEVVYNTDTGFITNMVLNYAQRRYNFKYILGIHDSIILRETPIEQTFLKHILLYLYKPFRTLYLKNIPNIHVLNSTTYLKLKKLKCKGNLYLIPNFVYLNSRHKRTKRNNKFIALFVGRLSIIQKGIDLFADIIEKTLKINTDILFHILGSGDDGEDLIVHLAKKYPKNVKWLGFVKGRELLKEYNDASIFLLPSRFEAFPLSVIEAQSCGLPTIAFDIAGPRDIIKNTKYSSLIKPFDTDTFTVEISKYYKLWKQNKIGYNNIKTDITRDTLSRFSEKIIIPKLSYMFSSDIDSRATSS